VEILIPLQVITMENSLCQNFLITNIIIPFFVKYPLVGAKRQDYLDFCKVAELMKNKAHLTPEGLAQIREIKAGMNTGREHDKP